MQITAALTTLVDGEEVDRLGRRRPLPALSPAGVDDRGGPCRTAGLDGRLPGLSFSLHHGQLGLLLQGRPVRNRRCPDRCELLSDSAYVSIQMSHSIMFFRCDQVSMSQINYKALLFDNSTARTWTSLRVKYPYLLMSRS